MEYTIKNDMISVAVSSRGGEPKSIISNDFVSYLYEGNPNYWPGSGPHLFPFIGRLFEARYLYDSVSYPLSIHGFLKDSEMELEELGDDYIVLRLDANETTLTHYPFDFTLKISYILEENVVKIIFDIQNNDKKDMPFAIGGHPGFNVPIEEGLVFEDYYLEFDEACSPKRSQPTESNLLNGVHLDFPLEDGRRIYLKHSLFDDDAIILKDAASSVTLKSDKGTRAVRVDYDGFKYIGFWHTVKSDAPFVCIEPWSALQGFENEVQQIDKNDDMIVLKQSESTRREIKITIIS